MKSALDVGSLFAEFTFIFFLWFEQLRFVRAERASGHHHADFQPQEPGRATSHMQCQCHAKEVPFSSESTQHAGSYRPQPHLHGSQAGEKRYYHALTACQIELRL